MSPEQVAAGVVDARIDVYGLGCVVYEMLAGQPPFIGPTAESLAHQHLNVPAPEVTRLRPSAGAGVTTALMRALAKTPADRYATTGAFAAALAAKVQAPPQPRTRSARWMAVTAAGVVLVLVALAAWQQWWPFGGRTAPPPAKNEWILVAEFEGPRDEPDIARAAQGLTAAALDQSSIVMTVPRDQLGQALEQAGRPDSARVDGRLARELAYRNGIRAVLEGRVNRVGKGFSAVLRLSDSGSDSTLITVSGSARDGDALIPALDRLARLGVHLVDDEPLYIFDRNGFVDEIAIARRLAAMVANATTNSWEGIFFFDDAQRVVVASFAHERDVTLGARVDRAGIAAG